MANKILFTQAGYDKIAQDIKELREQRVEAVQMLSTARDMGDRSENAAYKSARAKLSSIDSRILRLETVLRKAKIVASSQNGIVDIGSKVTVNDGTHDKTYEIVGSYESDVIGGKISHISPIGKGLLGKRVGDTVRVLVPNGELVLKINSIA